MVEQEPVGAELHDAVVVGPAAHRAQDDALVLIGAQRAVGHRIGNLRLMAVEGAVAVGEIILAVVFVHPGRLEELFQALDDVHFPVVGDHVFVQLDAAAGILPHEHISLPVVVNKHARVDEIAVADDARRVDGKQRTAQRVRERPPGMVRHGDADILDIRREIEIIFPVPLHAVGRPRPGFSPDGLLERPEDDAPVFERLHVGRHVAVIVFHVESHRQVTVVAGIDIQGIPEDVGGRVRRVHVRDDGIARQLEVDGFGGAGGKSAGQASGGQESLHRRITSCL